MGLQGKKGREREIIRLANQALAIQPSADGYFLRAYAKVDVKDYEGAITDYNKAIAINPQSALAHTNRGVAKFLSGDHQGACLDFRKGSSLGSKNATKGLNRVC